MTATKPLRVLLADDSPDIVRVIECFIQNEPDMTVVGVLGSADGLLAAIIEAEPDVVILDLTMPGKPPLEAVREACDAHPQARALVCSGYDNPRDVESALDAGAWGFFSKHAGLEGITTMVRDVAAGRVRVARH